MAFPCGCLRYNLDIINDIYNRCNLKYHIPNNIQQSLFGCYFKFPVLNKIIYKYYHSRFIYHRRQAQGQPLLKFRLGLLISLILNKSIYKYQRLCFTLHRRHPQGEPLRYIYSFLNVSLASLPTFIALMSHIMLNNTPKTANILRSLVK